MRLFILAAVVLTVFMLVAAASATGLCLGSNATVWLAGALLAFFADLLLGERVSTYIGTRRGPPLV